LSLINCLFLICLYIALLNYLQFNTLIYFKKKKCNNVFATKWIQLVHQLFHVKIRFAIRANSTCPTLNDHNRGIISTETEKEYKKCDLATMLLLLMLSSEHYIHSINYLITWTCHSRCSSSLSTPRVVIFHNVALIYV